MSRISKLRINFLSCWFKSTHEPVIWSLFALEAARISMSVLVKYEKLYNFSFIFPPHGVFPSHPGLLCACGMTWSKIILKLKRIHIARRRRSVLCTALQGLECDIEWRWGCVGGGKNAPEKKCIKNLCWTVLVCWFHFLRGALMKKNMLAWQPLPRCFSFFVIWKNFLKRSFFKVAFLVCFSYPRRTSSKKPLKFCCGVCSAKMKNFDMNENFVVLMVDCKHSHRRKKEAN